VRHSTLRTIGNRFLKTTMTTDHRAGYVRPCWLTVLLYLALGLPESLAFQQQPITDRLRTLNPNVLTEATRQDQAQKLASSIRLRITAANRRSSEDWARSQIARNGSNSRNKRFSCSNPLSGRFRHCPRTWPFTLPRLFPARDSRLRTSFSKAGRDCGSLPTCIPLNPSERECPASCFVTATTIPRLRASSRTWE
jgi:hypothetical protein